MEEPPFGSVELIEQRDDLRVVEAVIPKPLSDVGPVLLFHMGVVILVIGPAAGKLHGMLSVGEVSQEMMIQELRAVVTVKSQ